MNGDRKRTKKYAEDRHDTGNDADGTFPGPECPRGDSNSYSITTTSPSSWRVYQFHHLGVGRIVLKACVSGKG